MSKILKIAAISFVAGLAISIGGLFVIGFNFDKLNNQGDPITYEKNYNKQDIKDLKLNIPYGTVELKANNDIDNVKLKIETYTKENWDYNIVDGLFSIENKSNLFQTSWWNIFSNYNKKSTISIEIPHTLTFGKVNLLLSAGNMVIDGLVFDELTTKVSAGKLTLNNIKGTRINSKNSAGETNINNANIKYIDSNVSAGEIKLNTVIFDELKFNLSAGDLNAKIKGDVQEYNINVEVSAGNCNIKNQTVFSNKKIEGKVSAGNAHFTFNK